MREIRNIRGSGAVSLLRVHGCVTGNFSHRALTINSNEAKIKAIQAKLALMKKETPPASSDAGGKQPSSYSARNPSLRDRPY
jgi:hypothetical protein